MDQSTHAQTVQNRLVIVVRADPVICGHSVEARNIAETALERGFDEVRIVTWPIDRLEAAGLPLKPQDAVLPYSDGIVVERPGPVGDYKVPDGRWTAGMTGRLVELFTDGVPTVCLSLYLSPHTLVVTDALRAAWSTGLPVDVTTIAEAVGSDVTNVVRRAVEEGRLGAAAHIFSSYLAQDHCVAVSEYTRTLVIEEAERVDATHGTRFAPQLRARVGISYPAIDADAYLDLEPAAVDAILRARGLRPGGYVLFLSRLTEAKGVEDLIAGYERSRVHEQHDLIIAGRGPQEAELRRVAAASPLAHRIRFLVDVGDSEKPALMAGCSAFVLPSKPRPEFVETFGIALAEKMLAGGGPIITTLTGGIGEAIGEHAFITPVEDPDAIAALLDHAVLELDEEERRRRSEAARAFALQFDRRVVFDRLFARVARPVQPEPAL
ncbi:MULTISPECIES: glycosyltransferase [unclassified Rathayibacter]|uniref:glycosyltransferase n=1 Tax=unclassified Rathayibacter TaxID=2609250 RepID=UPI00188BE4A7|nr:MULTISPECIES: glycosyltransferase [unclassified Rathayibacter]MBF4463224.1 glycosyltransferase family 4 protein [Rathayibacter sp. VKM Ac-2879]MBF4504539.1 glycosyltransferase family 4 protein [Rathayibacter sp. VKM Ac-2878]